MRVCSIAAKFEIFAPLIWSTNVNWDCTSNSERDINKMSYTTYSEVEQQKSFVISSKIISQFDVLWYIQ
jgi:hypothetical protein